MKRAIPMSGGTSSSGMWQVLLPAAAGLGLLLLIGWRVALALDSALLGGVAAAMVLLVAISAMGAVNSANQR
jgi:hypothetical protein